MAKLTAEVKQGRNILIYGGPKSGKTALAAELANLGFHLHVMDLERGSETFRLVVEPENYGNVDIYNIEDHSSKATAIKTVSQVLHNAGPVTFCEAHGIIACPDCKKAEADFATLDVSTFGKRDVLLIDSLTQLSNSAMVHALGPRSPLATKKPEWDHYNSQGQLLDFVLGKAQAAGFHTIFISHEADLEQEDGTSKLAPVGGTRNYSRNIGRFFDHVVYCQVKNKKHQQVSLSTENAKISAGNRFNIDLAENPELGLAALLEPSPELLEEARRNFREARSAAAKKAVIKK